MNEIFLDTETTGLSIRDKHRIVEVACIETKGLVPTKNVFHKLINPQREVPEDAVKIHGFTTEILKKEKTFEQVADDFLNFVKEKKLIIHNADFDLSFLNHELRLLKKDEIKKKQVIDSLELAREKFPGVSNSLDNLCKRFKIDLSRRTKHNALLDCELLREVYINLLDAKEPKLAFSEDKAEEKNEKKLSEKNYYKKIIKPSPEEILRHSKFLKTELKKNYY